MPGWRMALFEGRRGQFSELMALLVRDGMVFVDNEHLVGGDRPIKGGKGKNIARQQVAD